MFKRPHHQKVVDLLRMFDASVLTDSECYFAGGTAIVLSLQEYRESVDVDFLCSSKSGFRLLRNLISTRSLGLLLQQEVKHLREVRCERDKISTFLEVEGIPIKVEFILEGNVDISGEMSSELGIPILSRDDMYATKLLANADRGLDKSTLSRDIIDLAMMIQGWGSIPIEAWEKAKTAYGESVVSAFGRSIALLDDADYLLGCLKKMKMDEDLVDLVPSLLKGEQRLLIKKSEASISRGPR